MFDPRTLKLSLPAIASPMFIVSGVELVKAQCRAGIVGSFPALNARPSSLLDEWLAELNETVGPANGLPPYAVNLIVHGSNNRLEEDLALCEKHKVPMIITSLGARPEVNQAVHGWGGFVFHDVIHQRFAHKAIEKGADGLVLVAAGAGGHAGVQSPFALVAETREWFDGPIALSGAMGTGRAVAAARCLGADFGYVGSAFIATTEANAQPEYKQMIVDSAAEDIVYSATFTGVHGNYLIPSIKRAGLDPTALPEPNAMDFATKDEQMAKRKAWKDIWGAGQGIGSVKAVTTTAELVERFRREYEEARAAL
jgi:nitronate monooxygenase